jgi:hydroxymethylbilane synthase
MSASTALRVGTRGSALARWQASHVAELLAQAGMTTTETIIRTKGDVVQDRPLTAVGGKGLFTKEIDEALLRGEVDVAVHSAKDLPSERPPGLLLAAFLPREDPRDALVARDGLTLDTLPVGARVGSSSLRRVAQLRALRPDLESVALRGNVDTRVRRVEEGVVDAALLAMAGLRRLGLDGRVTQALDTTTMLPAPGQGALAIEIRDGDLRLAQIFARLSDPSTFACVTAERALQGRLAGGCQTPIAAHARVEGSRLTLEALVASLDGRTIVRSHGEGSVANPTETGIRLAEDLLARGAGDLLQAARALGTDPQGSP